MILFGKYHGTVRDSGFFWANPFYTKRLVSLRLRNMETERLKVGGVVWRVENTAQAGFGVANDEAPGAVIGHAPLDGRFRGGCSLSKGRLTALRHTKMRPHLMRTFPGLTCRSMMSQRRRVWMVNCVPIVARMNPSAR